MDVLDTYNQSRSILDEVVLESSWVLGGLYLWMGAKHDEVFIPHTVKIYGTHKHIAFLILAHQRNK